MHNCPKGNLEIIETRVARIKRWTQGQHVSLWIASFIATRYKLPTSLLVHKSVVLIHRSVTLIH